MLSRVLIEASRLLGLAVMSLLIAVALVDPRTRSDLAVTAESAADLSAH